MSIPPPSGYCLDFKIWSHTHTFSFIRFWICWWSTLIPIFLAITSLIWLSWYLSTSSRTVFNVGLCVLRLCMHCNIFTAPSHLNNSWDIYTSLGSSLFSFTTVNHYFILFLNPSMVLLKAWCQCAGYSVACSLFSFSVSFLNISLSHYNEPQCGVVLFTLPWYFFSPLFWGLSTFCNIGKFITHGLLKYSSLFLSHWETSSCRHQPMLLSLSFILLNFFFFSVGPFHFTFHLTNYPSAPSILLLPSIVVVIYTVLVLISNILFL